MRPFASTARVAPEMTPKLKASKLRIVTSSGSEEDMPTEAQESTESVSANETPSDEGLKNTAPKIEDDPPPEPRIMDLILLVMEHNKRKFTRAALCCPCYMFVGPRGRMGLARLMQARIYMITQIATTLFSLIALDLFYATTDKTYDFYCDIGLTFCFCFFLIDTIIVSSVDRRHVFSLFWWLDVLSIITLLFEMEYLSGAIMSSMGIPVTAVHSSGKTLAVSSKLAKFTKVVKVIRLVRIVRLFAIMPTSCSAQGSRDSLILNDPANRMLIAPKGSTASLVMRTSSMYTGPAIGTFGAWSRKISSGDFNGQASRRWSVGGGENDRRFSFGTDDGTPLGNTFAAAAAAAIAAIAEEDAAAANDAGNGATATKEAPRPPMIKQLSLTRTLRRLNTQRRGSFMRAAGIASRILTFRRNVSPGKTNKFKTTIQPPSIRKSVSAGRPADVGLSSADPQRGRTLQRGSIAQTGPSPIVVQAEPASPSVDSVGRSVHSPGDKSRVNRLKRESSPGSASPDTKNGRPMTPVAENLYSSAVKQEVSRSTVGVAIDTKIRMKVVVGVMILFMVLQFFSSGEIDQSIHTAVKFVDFAKGTDRLNATVANVSDMFPHIMYYSSDGVELIDRWTIQRAKQLREFEVESLFIDDTFVQLDVSDQARNEALFTFLGTNLIIIILGMQAVLITKDVDKLLVKPIEKITQHLRPVFGEAIRFLCTKKGNNWGLNMSRGDEELSTKLIIASIEVLRQKLHKRAQQQFRARTVLTGLRRLSFEKGGVDNAMKHLRNTSVSPLVPAKTRVSITDRVRRASSTQPRLKRFFGGKASSLEPDGSDHRRNSSADAVSTTGMLRSTVRRSSLQRPAALRHNQLAPINHIRSHSSSSSSGESPRARSTHIELPPTETSPGGKEAITEKASYIQ